MKRILEKKKRFSGLDWLGLGTIFFIQVWKRYEAQEFISMWGCSYHMQLTLENYFISCIKVVVLCIKNFTLQVGHNINSTRIK